jgi:hypothetical protein
MKISEKSVKTNFEFEQSDNLSKNL